MPEIHLTELEKLREHEETDPEHLKELTQQIATDKILKHPIVVDEKTNTILDGEHRFNALKNLGCKRIPAIYVDYNSSDIVVQTWRNHYNLTKRDVMEAALSGKLFPPKTTCHMIRNSETLMHISSIEKRVDIPLEVLKGELKLTPIKNVKAAMGIELADVLSAYARFLKSGIVDTPLIVDNRTGILLYGYEAFQALDLLFTEKVPTFKVNLKNVEIKTSNPQMGSLSVEDIIQAGTRGPKLPPKSFSLLAEPVKIS
ncbi:MAG: ParB N-terminal domain-containing protein, partial [Candidatus Bathyarchaeia archaeon]